MGVKNFTKLKAACEDVAALLSALSHPGRLLILGALHDGEKTVGELQDICGLSQSQLSQFLSRMKGEQLLACRREGRFQYYFLSDPKVRKLVRELQKLYCS